MGSTFRFALAGSCEEVMNAIEGTALLEQLRLAGGSPGDAVEVAGLRQCPRAIFK